MNNLYQDGIKSGRDQDKSVPGSGSNLEQSIPGYITEAAVIISEALDLESEERYAESVEAYRSAIGKQKLLKCVSCFKSVPL